MGKGRVRIDVEYYVKINDYAMVITKYSIPGNESLPSPIPRSERMTEMKWMHVDLSSGKLLLFVSNLTSAVEIFPTTLKALSTTATLVNPSSLMSCRASERLLSPL